MNRKFVLNLLAGMAGLFICSCAAKPILTNFHEGVYGYDSTKMDVLEVTVTPRPVIVPKEDKPVLRTFVDFPDSLKHLYLKTMAARTKTPEELVKALQIPLVKEEKKEAAPRPTKFDEFKLVFEFSNTKKYYNSKLMMHPGTRMELLNTTLSIAPDSYASFYSIDKLQNEIEQADFGALSRMQNVKYDLKLTGEGSLGSGTTQKTVNGSSNSNSRKNDYTGTAYNGSDKETGKNNAVNSFENGSTSNRETNTTADAKATAKAEAAYANEQVINEARAVKLERMRLGFAMKEKSLSITQGALPGGDISLNVFVTAVLQFKNPKDAHLVDTQDVYYFENLFDADNQATPAKDLSFSKRRVTYVNCKNATDINLSSSYEGSVRMVGNEKGKSGNNMLEYDDHVTYRKLIKGVPQELKIDAQRFCKNTYRVVANIDEGKEDYVLRISAPLDMKVTLFTDDEPELFLQWLRNVISQPKVAALTSKKIRLYFYSASSKKSILVVGSEVAKSLKDLDRLSNIRLEEVLPPVAPVVDKS
jgi:hypothetical protein